MQVLQITYLLSTITSVLVYKFFCSNHLGTFRIDRQKQKKTVEFQTLHHDHIEMWDQFMTTYMETMCHIATTTFVHTYLGTVVPHRPG